MARGRIEATDRARAASSDGDPSGARPGLLGEPLVHFFAVGALVFAAYWLFGDGSEAAARDHRIEIGASDIRQIAIAWRAQGRPPLTRDQLEGLVNQRITEEVLYREGLALGLDVDDEIVKRRIVQKMDFLAADMADLQEPDRAELSAWFSSHSERFAIPPHVSFRHLYFSPDERGPSAHDDAVAALESIAGEPLDSPAAADVGDRFMLRSSYRARTPQAILKEFGPGFAAALFRLEPGGWRGPIRSGYGWHLVFVEAIEPMRVPAFGEVEREVRSAWRDARYQEIKRSVLEQMLARYSVEVVPLDSVDLRDLDLSEGAAADAPRPVAR